LSRKSTIVSIAWYLHLFSADHL